MIVLYNLYRYIYYNFCAIKYDEEEDDDSYSIPIYEKIIRI